MAGFVFLLDSFDSLERCILQGAYGTIFGSDPSGWWKTAHEATFADYCSMREGDGVFFFTNRKLYGVGRLTRVGFDCRYQNFPGATANPSTISVDDDAFLLGMPSPTTRQRWMCTFEPDPHFFAGGVDMDDALTYRPTAFRTLRAMWQRSFVRIDDEEEQALKDVIYRTNRAHFADRDESGAFPFGRELHEVIKGKVSPDYHLDPSPMVELSASADGSLTHEMALEAAIVFQLSERIEPATGVFGSLDYVAHQVTGSPPKPPMYIDHIDVMGLTYLRRPTVLRYSVVEIKKGNATIEDVEQTMKYVDWVKDEYCFGDYSMVNAFLVAFDFDDETEDLETVIGRTHTVGRRPPETRHWQEFVRVRYRVDKTVIQLFPMP
jgi:hypothetical protein